MSGLKNNRMRKLIWVLVFVVVLLFHLAGIIHEISWLAKLTKPVLIPVLGYFLFDLTYGIKNRLITLFLVALLFSWFGDLLLMNTAPSFFSIRPALFFGSAALLQLFFLSDHGARENQVQLVTVFSCGDLLCCFD